LSRIDAKTRSWEEIMPISRRDLAAAGALAFGAASLLANTASSAEGSDEAGVTQAVEAFRKATLAQDKAKLEQLFADQLSYGHSDGRVESKAEVINGVMNRKSVVKSIDFPELKIAVVGNSAVARHLYVSESEMDGKPTSTKIGALQVWQKQDGNWKLLARQGYKLA
jgi:ketosteroid isomerase-like protein